MLGLKEWGSRVWHQMGLIQMAGALEYAAVGHKPLISIVMAGYQY